MATNKNQAQSASNVAERAEPMLRLLIAEGFLKERPPDDIFAQASKGVLWSLASAGLVKEKEVLQFLSKHFDLSYVDLEEKSLLETVALNKVGRDIMPRLLWEHHVLPLWEKEGELVLATSNPLDQEGIHAIAFSASRKVSCVLAEESKIVRLLARFHPQTFSMEGGADPNVEIVQPTAQEEDLDRVDVSAPPIVRLANKILSDAIRYGASDIHLEPSQQSMSVRFRIDGILQEVITIPRALFGHVTARLKIMSSMNIAEKRRPQDGRLRIKISEKSYDLRVSSIPTAYGEKLVLRVLSSSFATSDFSGLAIPPHIEARIKESLHKRGKLFLVSGPTGSGKSTTLYVGLQSLIDGTTNISTIEDPIEYRLKGVNQTQINEKAKITFASVLRSLLRQDPDVIMVGEIRDSETLQCVLQAAQTGHLVLSTVHTNDAPSAVLRLKNLGADTSVLASCLIGVLAQRLVRKICPECKQQLPPETFSKSAHYLERYSLPSTKVSKGQGCEFCSFSGYKGRVGIYSHLHVTDLVAKGIYEDASQEDLISYAARDGFMSIEESSLRLVADGVTTFEEVRPYLDEQVSAPRESSSAAADPGTGNPAIEARSQQGQEIRICLDTGAESATGIMARRGVPERPRVLLIDDNKSVRKLLASLLRKEVAEVFEAENGMEGLDAVYRNVPHLVVCDVSMPIMDGREFLQKMKRNRQTRDIPIIMLTIDDEEEREIDLLSLGARSFLSKKTSPLVMVTRIRSIIDAL